LLATSLIAAIALASCSSAPAPAPQAAMLAPEFLAKTGDWINTPPLTMKGLRGKVVLVDFWEYTCVNCIRTFPYLKAWHERYKDKGLVIVGIHTPEFKFAGDHKNLQQAVKDLGLPFAVLDDAGYRNWTAYGNQYWPHKFLIDKTGKVVYHHIGEGGYGETEAQIQKALKQIDPNVQLPPVMEPVRAPDKPGAVCHPITHEMYAGERGYNSDQFGYKPFGVGKARMFAFPSKLQEGVFYLSGTWTPQDESLQAAGKGSALAIQYKAKECNAVVSPMGGPLTMELLQDGSPVRKEDAGADVRMEGGKSVVRIDKPRMYSLTVNKEWGHHRLELRPLGPGFRLFSFTFASDCVEK
jgi:thiol-disulfide isomerase/thioredoxin